MKRTYCDRCRDDITGSGETVRVEVLPLREYAFKDLCPSCLALFISHLNVFIPDFIKPRKIEKPGWFV
jgi:hypothetical protein